MTGAPPVLEEAPTNEPDISPPRPPPDRDPRRLRKVRMALAVAMVLLLVLPIVLQVSKVPTDRNPPGREPTVQVPFGFPGPPERPFMNVTGHRTLRGRDMTVVGDVLVQDGATLDIEGCNISMNGSFYVMGALNVRNCSLRNLPEIDGFEIESGFWMGPDPGPHTSEAAIIANLSGCGWARLNFSARYDTEAEVAIDVVQDGNRTMMRPGFTGRSDGARNVSVDLSRFCGGVVRLEFASDGYVDECDIIGPCIETDRFRTVTEDLIMDWGEYAHGFWEFYYPFEILASGGNISIADCSLERQSSQNELITAVDSTIAISGSEFTDRPPGPGHQSSGYGLMDGNRCTVRIQNSTFLGAFGTSLYNSNLSVEDSEFMEGSGGAIWVTNTQLSVSRCRFVSYNGGIFARTDTPGARGSVTVRDCTLDCEEEAIALKAVFGTVERCTIKARYPFVIHLDSRFSRANCTMGSIASIANNSVEVNPYSQDPDDWIGVWLFSAIPVDGLEGLVQNNTWSAAVPVARCIFLWVRVAWFPGEAVEVSLERNGTRSDYDGDLAMRHMAPASEGRETARERNEVIFYEQPFDDTFGYTWDTRRLVPMDRFFSNGTGFSRLTLDERRLDFLLAGPGLVVRTRFDAGAFRHPGELIRLQNSTAAMQLNTCDLGLSALAFSYDTDRSVLNVSFTMENRGKAPVSVALGCTLGGRLLESWTSAPWRGPWTALSLERQNLTSGELVIRAMPEGLQDWNLSNNELRSAVQLVNGTRLLEGQSELGGFWLLNEGADLTLQNCTVGLDRTDTVILGMGDCSVSLQNSTVDLGAGRLSMNVSRGSIRDSDLPAGIPARSGSVYESLPTVELLGGSWDICNTTLGCRADGFDGYRQRYLSDPVNAVYGLDIGPRGQAIPRVVLATETRSLNISESNMLLYYWSWTKAGSGPQANSSLAVVNSTLGAGGLWIDMVAERLLLRGSRFEAHLRLIIGAGDMVVEDCEFTDVFGGMETLGGNVTFTGNRFTATPAFPWAVTGLAVSATNLTLENNTFSGLRDAIVLKGSGEPPALAAANRFQNITGSRVIKSKHVTVEFLHLALELRVNREISNLTLTGPYLTDWDPGTVGLENTHLNATVNRTYNIGSWYIDENGTEHRLSEARFLVAVVSPSGAVSELELVIPIRDEDRWTVRFG